MNSNNEAKFTSTLLSDGVLFRGLIVAKDESWLKSNIATLLNLDYPY